jgi:hypothetical protein
MVKISAGRHMFIVPERREKVKAVNFTIEDGFRKNSEWKCAVGRVY